MPYVTLCTTLYTIPVQEHAAPRACAALHMRALRCAAAKLCWLPASRSLAVTTCRALVPSCACPTLTSSPKLRGAKKVAKSRVDFCRSFAIPVQTGLQSRAPMHETDGVLYTVLVVPITMYTQLHSSELRADSCTNHTLRCVPRCSTLYLDRSMQHGRDDT